MRFIVSISICIGLKVFDYAFSIFLIKYVPDENLSCAALLNH